MGRTIGLAGRHFGMLTVVKFDSIRNGHYYWTCLCECGNTKSVGYSNLLSGRTQSCGCRQGGYDHGPISHGMTGTPEYKAYWSVKRRIKYPRRAYELISMCQGYWDSPEMFMDDLGPKPSSHHQVDRIDNDGDYSCGRCADCINSGRPMNIQWLHKDKHIKKSIEERG
mgnify:CR=1 FL=1